MGLNDFKDRLPNKWLTVIIRDDNPMIHCQDSPSYRSVLIELTDEQVQKMALRCNGMSGGNPIYETVSKCFIEPEN